MMIHSNATLEPVGGGPDPHWLTIMVQQRCKLITNSIAVAVHLDVFLTLYLSLTFLI